MWLENQCQRVKQEINFSIFNQAFIIGTAFNELVSDNGEFALKIETEDDLLLGHLVLYEQANKVQLWHSDYSPNDVENNVNKAIVDVSTPRPCYRSSVGQSECER